METMIVTPQAEMTMKQKLQDILMIVSWREIARNYFGKSSSWLYHKLDGIDGNGGKGEFSEKEKEQSGTGIRIPPCKSRRYYVQHLTAIRSTAQKSLQTSLTIRRTILKLRRPMFPLKNRRSSTSR